MKLRRRISQAVFAAVGAGLITTGSLAWACTPQNGTTVFDPTYSSSGCSLSSCHKVTDTIAAYTTGVNAVSHTWKLYLNAAYDWCMTQNTQVGTTAWTGTGNVPRNTVKGSGAVLAGSYQLCFNNGNGGGETAQPVVITMI